MKTLIAIVTANAFVLLFAGPASAQLPSRPFLTGTWEGVMTVVGPEADGSPSIVPPFEAERGQYGFRLEIAQTNLVMYFQNGDQWIPFGQGLDLRLNQEQRSAIVVAALPVPQSEAVESMLLNIVRYDEDTILVNMSRVAGADGKSGQAPGVVASMGRLNRAAGD